MDQDASERMSPRREGLEQPCVADALFAVLRPFVRGIAETFGRTCEVVLHDFRHPEHSIVAIAGDVTQRHVGGSVTQIGLSILAQGDAAQDQINYITRTPSGRVLKSSTLIVRDRDHHVIGALCINFDVTDLRLLASTIGELAGSPLEPAEPITFVDDISQVIRAVVDEEEVALACSIDRMTKRERLALFRALDQRGVFALQRSVPQVAGYLGISRATVYSYLEEIRAPEVTT